MAAPHGQPWSNAEKNYLLAELIKYYSPPPGVLLNVVSQMSITMPNWNEIALPPGRSLNSCVRVFDEMRRSQPNPIPSGPLAPQTPSPISALGWKRPFPFDGPSSYPSGREIRPKPSSLGAAYPQSSPIEHPPTKKKRGRPTKAEVQARAEAQTAGIEAGPAPKTQSAEAATAVPQAQTILIPGAPSTEQGPSELARPPPLQPPVSRMPISSIITPTAPHSASQSSSSSGKRRRGRSTRSEPEDFPSVEMPGIGGVQEYESPYAGVAAEPQDTPARAALMRHREEHAPGPPYLAPQQRPTEQQRPTQPPPPTSTSDPETT